MQPKTTRAFRTISEAGEELGLQPHVLRFWESKFSDIKPIKRGGGRRFYRPEDIEFIRGIKILLHDEKHPIKDVQKLIRLKGPERVVELGRSVEQAANPKEVKDTVLIPERIQNVPDRQDEPRIVAATVEPSNVVVPAPVDYTDYEDRAAVPLPRQPVSEHEGAPREPLDVEKLEDALGSLKSLRDRWQAFRKPD